MGLVSKADFIGGDERAYLYTAGEGLVPRAVLDATRRYYEDKTSAGEGRRRQVAVERACRAMLATLLGAEPGDVALLASTSEGVNAVFSLIDWRPGDNLVIPTRELEFPSTVLPAGKRASAGIDVRVVDHRDWVIAPEDIAAAVDERTRLVFLSHVSWRTGHRFDLEAVSDAIRRRNPATIFAVDATQSLGVVPVPSQACDFVMATSCKWLLAPHGIGVFGWNRRRSPNVEPAGIGWYSVVDDLQLPYELKPDAARFELGGPNMVAIYGLAEGLKVLVEVGVERVARHVETLATRLIDGLTELELTLITPREPGLRAGIVSWLDPHFRETATALEQHGVIVTGSAGRVRAGIHLYNDERDVDRLVAAMRELVMHRA